MKKKILKTVLTFALAGALAFSSVGSGFSGMETVQAAKVVSPTTLSQVTGLAYDAEDREVTWNKVAGATSYIIDLKYPDGTTERDWEYDKNYYMGWLSDGTYSMVGTTTKTSFTDSSAESGKTYYYKVASYVKGEAKANIYSAKTSAKKVKVK